ncbi:TetR/AcrR family transcriptional regulator [Mycobacterium heidelbergense]|uniref:TetR family transcriptional regulator n=1 Tax=Mycobacterium heidelbergense TaxID=53376 RepID=A0A1X0DR18_MYCHE|nr:TetR/AcrR family transcriptional regulator [Mycobacterium heidelbergense]MCV7049704.1 TetR/AcrR family transcriptional regulator [Mycobacterium heidelbergense]ORA74629.1 TetR family transcriptional regulator [Mycobacterium heidelbergense]BBZ51285.1 TetR family transcriptional regulator [Mycobacterium heidelbergense]
MKNPPTGGRADTTRRQILRAAAHQFAQRAYHDVGLDDILAEAELTKGAMYFHFRSKHALAMAIIDEQIVTSNVAFQELLARKLSGLETLVDSSFLVAVLDINQDLTRAAMHLVEAVGRVEELHAKLLGGWIEALAGVVRDAIAEGDLAERCDPQDVARLIVSVYMGLRQTSNLDDPERFLRDLESSWCLLLTGILQPDRTDYFRQFISRRTALAISATSGHSTSD